MSLTTAGPLTRRPLGSRPPQSPHETAAQQVPYSPLSSFFAAHPSAPTARPGQRGVLCSPSSGSPLAQVPDGGSPLLRQVLDCKCASTCYRPIAISSLHWQVGKDREKTVLCLLLRHQSAAVETLPECLTAL